MVKGISARLPATPLRIAGRLLAAFLVSPALVPQAGAQGYPRGPITLVIPLAPGDATDIAGRTMGEELSRLLKVPVVPVNRPGAGGTLGTDTVVKAARDGGTILLANNAALTFRRVLEPAGVAYDPTRDLTPLALTTRIPSIIAVGQEVPYRGFADMVEYAKKNPNRVRVGTVGAGSVGDFVVQLVNSLTAAGIVMVPFNGAAPAIAALRGGHVEGAALALGAMAGQLKAGTARGVLLSVRFPVFPEIPTLIDLGYKQNIPGVWFGFFAPAGIPAEARNVLVSALETVAKNPAIAQKLQGLGMVQDYAPPERLQAEIVEETRSVQQMARAAGLVK